MKQVVEPHDHHHYNPERFSEVVKRGETQPSFLSELSIQYINIKSLQIVHMSKDIDDHLRRNKTNIMIY